ncbi:MAG: DUF554 domain-containing protein [Oscillospiraceae bacterium]|nr:DUF554 domain-containing protein [Oscillospiraceae bacterium]
MLGTWVNVAAVLVGGSIGLLIQKGLSQRLADTLMKGLALCTIYIGISGSFSGKDPLKLILSMVVGALIGEGLDLDGRIQRLGAWVERRFSKGNSGVSIAEGFVTASLMFCVGAMTIVGSLQSGLTGDHQTLFTKSMLDFVSSMIFASSLGVGVLFAAAFVLVFQGGITLLAGLAAPFLGEVVIGEMTCVGSVLIIGLGLNMLGVTKLKVMNYVPAIFLPVLLCLIW